MKIEAKVKVSQQNFTNYKNSAILINNMTLENTAEITTTTQSTTTELAEPKPHVLKRGREALKRGGHWLGGKAWEASFWLPDLGRQGALPRLLVDLALLTQLRTPQIEPFTGAILHDLNALQQEPESKMHLSDPQLGDPQRYSLRHDYTPLTDPIEQHPPDMKLKREMEDKQEQEVSKEVSAPLKSAREQYLLTLPNLEGKTHIYSSIESLFPHEGFSIEDRFGWGTDSGRRWSHPETGELMPFARIKYQDKEYIEIVPPIDKPSQLEKISFAVGSTSDNPSRHFFNPNSIGEMVILVDGQEIFKGLPGDLLDKPDSELKKLGLTLSHNDHEEGGGFSLFLPVAGRKIQVLAQHPQWVDVWVKYFDQKIANTTGFDDLVTDLAQEKNLVAIKENPQNKINLIGKKSEVSQTQKEKGVIIEADKPQLLQAFQVEIPLEKAEDFIRTNILKIEYDGISTEVALADLLGYMAEEYYQNEAGQFNLLEQYFVSHGLLQKDNKVIFYFNYPVALKNNEKITLTTQDGKSALSQAEIVVATEDLASDQSVSNPKLMFQRFTYPDTQGAKPKPNLVLKGNVVWLNQVVEVVYDATQSFGREVSWTFPPLEADGRLTRIDNQGHQVYMGIEGMEGLVPGAGFHFVAPQITGTKADGNPFWENQPMKGQTLFGGSIIHREFGSQAEDDVVYQGRPANGERAVMLLNPNISSGGDTVVASFPWVATFDDRFRSQTSTEVQGVNIYYAGEGGLLYAGEHAADYAEIADFITDRVQALNIEPDLKFQLQSTLFPKLISVLGNDGLAEYAKLETEKTKARFLREKALGLLDETSPVIHSLAEKLENHLKVSSEEFLDMTILLASKNFSTEDLSFITDEKVAQIANVIANAEDKNKVLQKTLAHCLTTEKEKILLRDILLEKEEFLKVFLEKEKAGLTLTQLTDLKEFQAEQKNQMKRFVKDLLSQEAAGKIDIEKLREKFGLNVDWHNKGDFTKAFFLTARLTGYQLDEAVALFNKISLRHPLHDSQLDYDLFCGLVDHAYYLTKNHPMAKVISVDDGVDGDKILALEDINYYFQHLEFFLNYQIDPVPVSELAKLIPVQKQAYRDCLRKLIDVSTTTEGEEGVTISKAYNLFRFGQQLKDNQKAFEIFNTAFSRLGSLYKANELIEYFLSKNANLELIEQALERAAALAPGQRAVYADYLELKDQLSERQAPRFKKALDFVEFSFANLVDHPGASFPSVYYRGEERLFHIVEKAPDEEFLDIFFADCKKNFQLADFFGFYLDNTAELYLDKFNLNTQEFQRASSLYWQVAENFAQKLGIHAPAYWWSLTITNIDDFYAHIDALESIVQNKEWYNLALYDELLDFQERSLETGSALDIPQALATINKFMTRPDLAHLSEMEKANLIRDFFWTIKDEETSFFSNDELEQILQRKPVEIPFTTAYYFEENQDYQNLIKSLIKTLSNEKTDVQAIISQLADASEKDLFNQEAIPFWQLVKHYSNQLKELDLSSHEWKPEQKKALEMFTTSLASRIVGWTSSEIMAYTFTETDVFALYLWTLDVPGFDGAYYLEYYEIEPEQKEALKPQLKEIIERGMARNDKRTGRFMDTFNTSNEIIRLLRQQG